MLKILYHGSTNIVDKPKFDVGNPHNDYGLGFYCTEVLELAKEWACPSQKLGNLGEQIVIKSKKAFENLKFENHELVDGELYYEKRKKRDSKAKETYLREMKYNKINSEDIFLIDIIREQVKQNDKRLR